MLSNLLWWPWHGLPSGEVPPEPEERFPFPGGDRRVYNEMIRTHPPSDDDEVFAIILSER